MEIVKAQKAELAYQDNEAVAQIATIVKKVAPWANDKRYPMSDQEIGLSVRRAMAMGVDPLNPHEIQIWKDKRGTINVQLAYTLMSEWVKKFKGEHTEPRYYRLVGEQLTEEGLSVNDIAYRVKFVMIDDLPKTVQYAEVFGAKEAVEMFTVTGLGVATFEEYNGQYFAPAARSKSWKVEKRALTDAYRRKFGTPTKAEIEILRRDLGYDQISPDDWEGTEGLCPGDAVALAQSHAAPPAESSASVEEIKDDLFGNGGLSVPIRENASDVLDAPFVEVDPVPSLQAAADAENEAAQGFGSVKHPLPDDCPKTHWTPFLNYVVANVDYYENNMHVVNTLKASRLSTGDDWNPWKGALLNGTAAQFWAVLMEHVDEVKE